MKKLFFLHTVAGLIPIEACKSGEIKYEATSVPTDGQAAETNNAAPDVDFALTK